MRTSRSTRRRGFVQVELATLVIVTLVLVGVLSVAGGGARHRARMAGSISNLQKFAAGITAFAADNEDRIVAFSWRAGPARTDRTGFRFPNSFTDMQAAADQAVAIMRWHGDRPDISPITNWIPHPGYSHLALIEYLDHRLPAEFTVSPFDLNRISWQRATRNNPGDMGAAFFSLRNRPEAPGSSLTAKRWPYSSSYEFGPATFSPDARILLPGGGRTLTIAQGVGATHRQYDAGSADTPLGRRRVSEIVYPDKKAVVYETHAADSGGGLSFYAYDHVKTPILFGDGSASARSMADANPGFQPNNPFSLSPTRILYSPETAWEPRTHSGTDFETVTGRIRWTRSGLRGRDFGGPEVPWTD